MSRLDNYMLNEDKRETDYNIEDMVLNIKKKCKQSLGYMKKAKSFMWRYDRTVKENDEAYKAYTRRDRRPLDTPESVHSFIDGWFKREFGWKARSNNVLFIEGRPKRSILNIMDRKSNIKQTIVFPIGNIEFLWSPRIKDLTNDMSLEDIWYGDDEWQDLLEGNLNNAGYEDTNMKNALRSGNEIMIHCKSYYGMVLDRIDEDILDELGIA